MIRHLIALIALCLLAFGAQSQTLTNGQRTTICTACSGSLAVSNGGISLSLQIT